MDNKGRGKKPHKSLDHVPHKEQQKQEFKEPHPPDRKSRKRPINTHMFFEVIVTVL